MADAIITWYYDDDSFKKFMGYRVCAIDASILELNNSKRLRDAFGYSEGNSITLARAKASGIYDIENDLMLTSKITKYTTGEREIAIDLIEKLKKMGLKNDLNLFDRGYPSKDFITYLEDSGIKHVIRISSEKIRQVHRAQESDQIIDLLVGNKKTVKTRVVRFMLDSDVEEVLLTNLFDENIGVHDFKVLYFKRWGIETKFNELKNRLQIENFTGDTVIAIEQDFYASIYLSNMAALAKSEANEKIALGNKDKGLMYGYRVNVNILIGKLKDSLVFMLLEDDPQKRTAMYSRIMNELVKNVIPIRPGRKYNRRKSLNANKHSANLKNSL